MPCNCDHLEPNHLEIEISKVAYLLDELAGKGLNRSNFNDGMHPEVYGHMFGREGRERATMWTAALCERLQDVDVTEYSLEMQIWWRDHQAADKARAERELMEHQKSLDREAALAKLTDYERKLLGF